MPEGENMTNDIRGRDKPNRRKFTIIAQDPSVKVGQRILTATVEIPAEQLAKGPTGYRVKVIDYDVSTNTLYRPAVYSGHGDGYADPYSVRQTRNAAGDERLLNDPRFHAQNVYVIAMRTLARFEFALGRRVAWGCAGHQVHIAPHAFAEANAFYSRPERGIFFGYFQSSG